MFFTANHAGGNPYRSSISLFSIVNTVLEQMRDLDNSRFIDYIVVELKQNYDRLDLRKNYSIMVIPCNLGTNAILDNGRR